MHIDTIKVTETSGVELNIHVNLRKLRYYNLTGQFFHISETFNVWNLKMAEGLIFERFGMRYEIHTAASTNARKIILSHTNVFICFKMFRVELIIFHGFKLVLFQNICPKG
jgi:hypothetical protein